MRTYWTTILPGHLLAAPLGTWEKGEIPCGPEFKALPWKRRRAPQPSFAMQDAVREYFRLDREGYAAAAGSEYRGLVCLSDPAKPLPAVVHAYTLRRT